MRVKFEKFWLIVFGWIVTILVWIVLPFVCIQLNKYLKLPTYAIPLGEFFGTFLIFVSTLVVLQCSLKHYRTGRATVVPIEDARKLISTDLYKYTRNPIYLAAFATLFGLFLYFGHMLLFVYFCISLLVVNWYVIYVEERECRQNLGAPYIDYCERVPRWFSINNILRL